MERGQRVVEIATGRTATIINAWPNGTDSHSEPWAKIMFGLGTGGVGFCCRDLAELRFESEPAPTTTPGEAIGGSIMDRLKCCNGYWKHADDCLPGVTCDVQVADADYQITRCGNTAVYALVNGSERVCQFHRDGAVAIQPQSARHFVKIGAHGSDADPHQYDDAAMACSSCGRSIFD